MRNAERLSLVEIGALLEASEIEFEAVARRQEVYEWVTGILCQQEYWKQNREIKGLLRRYIGKMTGRGRAQVTRLISRYKEEGVVRERTYKRNRFISRYTAGDTELLAAVDEAHETLSGPATRKILYREFFDYGKPAYARLATISVAHIHNLRKSRAYRQKRIRYQKTRPVLVPIGARRRPDPQGRPGYLRVDTVHQGDLDGVKGGWKSC